MNWLLQIYGQIPRELLVPLGVLLAAMFTAAVAFTGVVITNRSAARRQRVELKSAAERQKLERDMELRKTVYLETLDALGALSAKFFDVWDFSKPVAQSIDLPKALGSTFRTYAVAEIRTIRAMINASAAASRVAMEVLPLRLKFETCKTSQQRLHSLLEQLDKQRDVIFGQLRDTNIDSARRVELEAERSRLNELIEKTGRHALDAMTDLVRQELEVTLLGVSSRARFERELWALIVTIRAELHIPIDEIEFTNAMQESSNRMLEVSRALVEEAQAHLQTLKL